jgi:hypothetical protein
MSYFTNPTASIVKGVYNEFYLISKNKKTIESVGIRDGFSPKMKKMFDTIKSILSTYDPSQFKKDISRIWFFINKTDKQIVASVHFNVSFIHSRQETLFSLLNEIVIYFRKGNYDGVNDTYNNYDIIFSGDFNINMLESITTDSIKCNYKNQQTHIYTTKSNKSYSFKDNDGHYNSTNIDFTIYYPYPNIRGGMDIKKSIEFKKRLHKHQKMPKNVTRNKLKT